MTKKISKLLKIPVIILGAFAVIGILTVGAIAGYEIGIDPQLTQPTIYKQLQLKNNQYQELILAYEELSRLYYEQGANIATVLDRNTLLNNPDKATQALKEVDRIRGLIILQQGRIIELRKTAGLPEETFEF